MKCRYARLLGRPTASFGRDIRRALMALVGSSLAIRSRSSHKAAVLPRRNLGDPLMTGVRRLAVRLRGAWEGTMVHGPRLPPSRAC
jgi:hypothetical protein